MFVVTPQAIACSMSSLGCMLGPPIGAVFYEIGGFGLPFFVLGGATILLEPLLIATAPEIKGSGKEHKTSQTSSSSAKSMPVTALAKSGLVWAGMLGLFMSAVGNVFLQPVLATHLETYGLTPFMIGMCFALHPVLYTIFTPLLGLLTDKFSITGPLLLLSSLGCCIAYLLIGPAPVLRFLPSELWVVLLGYMILGVSEAGLTIPTAKCLCQGATELGFPSDVRTHGIMSGLNVGGYHFGAFVGPLLAGTLTDVMGFGRSTFVISCTYLITFIVFCSIVGYRYKYAKGDDQKPEETAPLIQLNCSRSCGNSHDVKAGHGNPSQQGLDLHAPTNATNETVQLSD
ncbi:MFS-type transporter SLC18B1 [Elysia marginata]|uniref:MFS-type transporter SLC18B1 n=1 Tax=Elysia marginata TaxID=1093978 RepID=A0AAV4GUC3_9GAST|nr:MFS-type transporter SLC18B1 [Elysia marginata]